MEERLSIDRSRLVCLSETDGDWIFEVFKRMIPLAHLIELLWITSTAELLALPRSPGRCFVISALDRVAFNDLSLVEVTTETPLLEHLVKLTNELDEGIWIAELLQPFSTSEVWSKNGLESSPTDQDWSNAFGRTSNDKPSLQHGSEYPLKEQPSNVDAPPTLRTRDHSGVVIAVLGPRGSGVTSVSTMLAGQLSKVAQTVLVELAIDTDLGFLHDVDDHTPSLSEFFAQNSQTTFSNRTSVSSVGEYVCRPKGVNYDLLCGIWQEEHVGLIDSSSLQGLITQLQSSYRYIVCDIHPHFYNLDTLPTDGPARITSSVLLSASHLCLVTQNSSKWLYSLAKITKKITQLEELTSSWSVTINQSNESKAKTSKTAREVTQIIQLATVGTKYKDIDISLHRFAKRASDTVPPEPLSELLSLAKLITHLPPRSLPIPKDKDYFSNIAEIY